MAKNLTLIQGGPKSKKAGKFLMKGRKGWTENKQRAEIFDSKAAADRTKKELQLEGLQLVPATA